jgi:ketosteroid isomerase-like protein
MEAGMKFTGILLALSVAALPLAAQAAPRVTSTLPPTDLAQLEAVRKDVWVQWFAGDTAALRTLLGPELIAISPESPNYQSLEATLAGSAGFKATGAILKSVRFENTKIHRFGDVVVMFSHYTIELDKSGQRSSERGRATEVFVRHNGRWVHTSWHLDVI